ncbi:Protein kinase domain containing protein [Entamoeba marina]
MQTEFLKTYGVGNFCEKFRYFFQNDFFSYMETISGKFKNTLIHYNNIPVKLTPQLCALRKFLLSTELYKINNMLEIRDAELSKCEDENVGTIEFWINCRFCYPQFLDEYLNNGISVEEIKFMTYNLLQIAQDVTKLKKPCVINYQTVMLIKDRASPFPKLVLSPLAFLLAIINEYEEEDYEEPLVQISNIIKNLGHLQGNDEIISNLRNLQPIEEVMKMKTVRNIISFINFPVSSIDNYNQFETLGKGSFGSVSKARNSTNDFVAIKSSLDDVDDEDSLKREAIIMRLCNHTNIVKFIAVAVKNIEYPRLRDSFNLNELHDINLVMEYCDGGNLKNYIVNYRKNIGNMPLDLIGNIFYQVTEAQHYLHFEKRIIHRDIKPDNYLIVKSEPYPIVKCCDFGLGRSITNKMFSIVGAEFFAAPAIFWGRSYSDKSDLYSLGIFLFYLITNYLPFSEDYDSSMKLRAPIVFPLIFQNNSDYEYMIDLVEKLTKYEERERISWEEFYAHPYMKQIRPN